MKLYNALAFLVVTVCVSLPLSGEDWPHWGGPTRDFVSTSRGLADSWSAAGPPQLWRRELGEGYSAITAVGGALYTQYRVGEEERVIALDAASGETVWETTYGSATEGWRFDRGAGPHATPSVAGGRVFATGATGVFHALDAESGEIVWSYDLMEDYEASFRHRGYSSSPMAFGEMVLVPVGGEGRTIVAFEQASGREIWRAGDDDNSYSSPIVIDVGGREQLVAFGANVISGLDLETGGVLWSHSHPTRGAFNISTPLYSADDGLLFLSSAYDGGGRVLSLQSSGDGTTVDELWFSNQMRVHFGTAIRIGDAVYASSGDFGPAPLTSVDLRTGDVLWRDRAFAKSSVLYADGKLVVLDEDGVLGLIRVDREGLEELARFQIFDSLSWTVPTLVGTTLYLRNREEIAALDLAAAE